MVGCFFVLVFIFCLLSSHLLSQLLLLLLFCFYIQGRDGKGSIFTFAAGNGGEYYDSCAADGYTNSIYTISVGSADQNGNQADYDEDCSAKMVVTYSYNSDTFPTYEDNWDAYNQIVRAYID